MDDSLVIILDETLQETNRNSGCSLATSRETRRRKNYTSVIIDLTTTPPRKSGKTKRPNEKDNNAPTPVIEISDKTVINSSEKDTKDPLCPICLESLMTLEKMVTSCGHVYCKKCIDILIAKPGPICPKCRKKIIKTKVAPIYF